MLKLSANLKNNLSPSGKHRVISFVPSLTETFFEAGINVIGRTHFCLYPKESIDKTLSVGGTKNINENALKMCITRFESESDYEKPENQKLTKVKLTQDKLTQDKLNETTQIHVANDIKTLILFDEEENTQDMVQTVEALGFQWIATHITCLKTCGEQLIELGFIFENDLLKQWGQDYLTLSNTKLNKDKIALAFYQEQNYNKNSKISLGNPLSSIETAKKFKVLQASRIHYVIWKDPWMVVTKDTFIGHLLSLFGYELLESQLSSNQSLSSSLSPSLSPSLSLCANSLNDSIGSQKSQNLKPIKYPQITEEQLLSWPFYLSSEPYPFAKNLHKIQKLMSSSKVQDFALLDGEKISWYGIRALRFLKACL